MPKHSFEPRLLQGGDASADLKVSAFENGPNDKEKVTLQVTTASSALRKLTPVSPDSLNLSATIVRCGEALIELMQGEKSKGLKHLQRIQIDRRHARVLKEETINFLSPNKQSRLLNLADASIINCFDHALRFANTGNPQSLRNAIQWLDLTARGLHSASHSN